MGIFASDMDWLAFLLEADATLVIDPNELGTDTTEQAQPNLLGNILNKPDASTASKIEKDMDTTGAPGSPQKRTNYIDNKQKLAD